MAWMVRLVKTGADGEQQAIDVATITRPDDLGEIAHLGLSLAEGKLVLAGLQRAVVAAQAEGHAVSRPDRRTCGKICRLEDHQDHAAATLFGRVTLRLPRFRCAGCGGSETYAMHTGAHRLMPSSMVWSRTRPLTRTIGPGLPP